MSKTIDLIHQWNNVVTEGKYMRDLASMIDKQADEYQKRIDEKPDEKSMWQHGVDTERKVSKHLRDVDKLPSDHPVRKDLANRIKKFRADGDGVVFRHGSAKGVTSKKWHTWNAMKRAADNQEWVMSGGNNKRKGYKKS